MGQKEVSLLDPWLVSTSDGDSSLDSRERGHPQWFSCFLIKYFNFKKIDSCFVFEDEDVRIRKSRTWIQWIMIGPNHSFIFDGLLKEVFACSVRFLNEKSVLSTITYGQSFPSRVGMLMPYCITRVTRSACILPEGYILFGSNPFQHSCNYQVFLSLPNAQAETKNACVWQGCALISIHFARVRIQHLRREDKRKPEHWCAYLNGEKQRNHPPQSLAVVYCICHFAIPDQSIDHKPNKPRPPISRNSSSLYPCCQPPQSWSKTNTANSCMQIMTEHSPRGKLGTLHGLGQLDLQW